MAQLRQGSGFAWTALGVAAATVLLWLARPYLDKGQASLLYLPVVIACAIRFGFGPAVLGAAFSFLCWNFFFLPPFGTFAVANPKDWISLFVFLLAAIITAQLAAQARAQTQQARAREAEIGMLFQASEALSREVRADSLLAALAQQLQTLCHASRCLVFRCDPQGGLQRATDRQQPDPDLSEIEIKTIRQLAAAACEHRQTIGFGRGESLWAKALHTFQQEPASALPSPVGAYIPLQVEKTLVGVLHAGPRRDGLSFSARDERLMLTLANHAAVAIAREGLAAQAAQVEALREADALKESLLSLVSHELRTPLAAIKASVTGLLDPRASWDELSRRDNLQAVDRETDRLTGVVGNLLDLSRLDAGAWLPRKDWCDLAEIVSTVLDRLPEPQAARMRLSMKEDLPLVRADYTQIALVLSNLLENAVKYAPAGSDIHLTAAPARPEQADAPPGVLLSVRDFGPGIAPGEEERLFERFYRGRAHQKSAIHGTGLGLALCRAVAVAHDGRIWAFSAPPGEPQGAVFTLWLPVGTPP